MNDEPNFELRLRRLDRRLRYTQAAAAIIVAAFAFVLWRDLRSLRQTTFTDSLVVPAAFWSGGPFLNLTGGTTKASLTIGSLRNSTQVRLEQAADGEAHLAFYDRKGVARLSVGVSGSGLPVLEARDANDQVVWSAPTQ